ncbi:MAG: hypothetical protein U5J83_00265 [Bryobacterales bacterium]|nr:hypothetical protein [Bryobacterales bacterium]
MTEWSGCDSSAYVRLVESDGPLEEWPAKGMPLAWEFLRGLDSGMRGRASVTASNAASYTRRHTAPGALASLFGESMSPATESAAGPGLPGTLAGVRVELRDRTGNTGNAGMVFVSPGQINVQIPDGLQTGMASMFVYQGQSLTHRDWLYVDASAPGLFANDATGAGPPAGEVLYIRPDGSRVSGPLATAIPLTVGSSGFVSAPVQLGEPGTEVYVILYGTGWASAEAGSVKAMLGGETLLPEYAGRQGGFTGLDQLNLRLDTLPEETIARLAGRVNPVSVCYGDVCSNRLQLLIEKALPAGQ